MWQNRRCSFLFHLEVLGGKCATESVRPCDRRIAAAAPSTAGARTVAGIGRSAARWRRDRPASPSGATSGRSRRPQRRACRDRRRRSPARVPRQVVHAVRNDIADGVVDEIVDADRDGLARRCHSRPPCAKSPISSFFGINRGHRRAATLTVVCLRADELELRVAVPRVRSFGRLLRPLPPTARRSPRAT